jgi:hypothetical protein
VAYWPVALRCMVRDPLIRMQSIKAKASLL